MTYYAEQTAAGMNVIHHPMLDQDQIKTPPSWYRWAWPFRRWLRRRWARRPENRVPAAAVAYRVGDTVYCNLSALRLMQRVNAEPRA